MNSIMFEHIFTNEIIVEIYNNELSQVQVASKYLHTIDS